MKKKKKPEVELLSPAGSFTTLKAVAAAGADAAYGSGNRFGARAYANNFSDEELRKAIDFMHLHDRLFYLTVNTLLKERELETELYDYIEPLYLQGLDGVIVQDIGVLSFLHKCFPDMELHASTQMSITGSYGARMMKDLGCSRIVTARELSLNEIREIHENVDIEIESFIHGSLCYCYSGQCLFSSMLGGRSGNRGRCAQPCRLPYEIKHYGCKATVYSPEYLLSPKDLCTIELLPNIIESGVYALKIEGRMKQAEYAAGVTAIYREYLDRYLNQPKGDYKVSAEDLRKLEDLGSRGGFTKGYYLSHNGPDMMSFEKPSHIKSGTTAATGSNAACGSMVKKKLQEQVQFHGLKEKMKGILILSKGFPAKLMLKCKETEITVTGDKVQKAKNRPLDQKTVEDKIRKTGNSAFFFGSDTLKVNMDEDIFIPVSSLNQLRREGLEKLTEAFTNGYKRNECFKTLRSEVISTCKAERQVGSQTADPYLAVSIEDLSQYDLLLTTPFITRIYVDCGAFPKYNNNLESEVARMVSESHHSGKEFYFCLPFLFRKDTAKWYEKKWDFFSNCGLDGFIARNYEELEFLRERKWKEAKIVTDSNLYTWSGEAGRLLKKLGVFSITLPLELNRRELRQRGFPGGELIIYGHVPLMTSAQCLVKNRNGCMHNSKQDNVNRQAASLAKKTIFLKDRYAKEFPVKNQCDYCYNIIYNSTPISLLHQYQEVMETGPSGLRISFTIESPKQMARILKIYENAYLNRETNSSGKIEVMEKEMYLKNYTNGHFKRGVE